MLTCFAGDKALKHIKENGLHPEDVSAVFGASGAAKWITIAGLDSAILSEWLPQSSHSVHLYGCSIGAWKFAAAAQADCKQSLGKLAHAYIEQRYGDKASMQDVIRETERIVDACFNAQSVSDILGNEKYFLHCGTTRCSGLMASENRVAQASGMAIANMRNLLARKNLKYCFERVVFSDKRAASLISAKDGIPTECYELEKENLIQTVLASGSIPFVMPGQKNIPGASEGMYRDGGLIDYHPVPSNFWKENGGIHLYPHFYSTLTPGWLDKPLKSRMARNKQLANVVLLSPDKKFIENLPYGRIPDRKDFSRFIGQDQKRIDGWYDCLEKSYLLGEEFLRLIKSGELVDRLQQFPD